MFLQIHVQLEPVTVTFFGNWIFANVIKLRWGHAEVKVLVDQSCPTLCNPVDCSPPGSSRNQVKKRSCGIRVGPTANDCCPSVRRGRFRHTDTHSEGRHAEDTDQLCCPQAQVCWQPPGAGRCKKKIPPEGSLEKPWHCWHLDFGLLTPRTSKW